MTALDKQLFAGLTDTANRPPRQLVRPMSPIIVLRPKLEPSTGPILLSAALPPTQQHTHRHTLTAMLSF
jgi:hypothetical protein